MKSIEEFFNFIEKIRILKFKYEKLNEAESYNFNLFHILRKSDDEVNLHSKFIATLLDPNGPHKKGDLFLKLFLKVLNIDKFETKESRVLTEYNNIDILIKNHKQAVIIENKIYASDQDKQLDRYYKIIKNNGFEDIHVIYLTLYGTMPSDFSFGENLKGNESFFKPVSYSSGIINWLEDCIKESATIPALREALIQYRNLIKQLTGQSMQEEYIMNVSKLLMENEKNMELAADIEEAFTEAKINTQFSFWEDLENNFIEKGYTIRDWHKYSRDKVDAFYKNFRNNRYYGLMLDLGLIPESNGEKLTFFIEIDWRIYCGFKAFPNDGLEEKDFNLEPQFDYLSVICNKIGSGFTRNEWWLGWKYPQIELDFRSFKDPIILSLVNKDKRSNLINTMADEIEALIKNFKEELVKVKTLVSSSIIVSQEPCSPFNFKGSGI